MIWIGYFCISLQIMYNMNSGKTVLFQIIQLIKLLPLFRQLWFKDKLVSWDCPIGRSQETKRPPGRFPPAFYIPIPDGAFPCYNISYNPLFCDIIPNHVRWFEIDLFVFDVSPESFKENIVDPRSLPSVLNFKPVFEEKYVENSELENWLSWFVLIISGCYDTI